MSALDTLQRDFQSYVLGEETEAPAVAGAVADGPGLPAAARLRIYHNAYRVRLRQALADAYDKTWTYLGDDLFRELCDSYLAAHPSTFTNLRWFGHRFAAHVAQTLPDYPVVAELAELEWTLGLAFDAADARPLTREALRAVTPQAWGLLAFSLHPSAQLIELRWNTAAIWQALKEGHTPPEPVSGQAVRWLVWRKDTQPHFRSLDPVEAQALQEVARGGRFGEVCESVAACHGDVTMRLAGCLQSWLTDGVLTA